MKEAQRTALQVRDLPLWNLVLAFVLGPAFAVGYNLWGCYQSTQGIVASDYIAAAFLWLFVSVAGYLGLRIGAKSRARSRYQ